MEFKDYYATLGVAKDATPEVIKKAYRKLARKYHPDMNKSPDAQKRMSELNEANAVLSDAEKRAEYDAMGRPGPGGAGFRPPPGWAGNAGFGGARRHAGNAGGAGGFGHFDNGMGGGAEDYSDFFEQFFGRARGGSAAPPRPQRGQDQHASITLDLQDSYHGAERLMELQVPQETADGRISQTTRQLQVKIPQGLREGQQIRLAGQGSPGSNGAPAGDLLLEIHFATDPRWHAEGRDVFQTLHLAPWEAALGTTAAVETPGGNFEVNVPAGYQPGRKLRLKGKGIPGKTPGDLFLLLELRLPKAETEAQRQAYQALAQAFPGFDARSQPHSHHSHRPSTKAEA